MKKLINSLTGKITDSFGSRDRLVLALRRELMGPCCAGRPIEVGKEIICEDSARFYESNVQANSRNEIIKGDNPRKRYGIGVLYPAVKPREDDEDPEESGTSESKEKAAEGISADCRKGLEKALDNISGNLFQKDGDDFDISLANLGRPKSMGISFIADLVEGSSVRVTVKGARYRPVSARMRDEGKSRTWWLRIPVRVIAVFNGENILKKKGLIKADTLTLNKDCEGINIQVELLSRPSPSDISALSRIRLITVCVVNRTPGGSEETFNLDERCLFQSRFSVRVEAPDKKSYILPYPEASMQQMDEEEESLRLLYRGYQTFATGHGCAADWDARMGDKRVSLVKAIPFPVFETPSITPEIHRQDKTEVLVSMGALAGLNEKDDGMAAVEEIIKLYHEWIIEKEKEIRNLDERYRPRAIAHLNLCRRSGARMKDGLNYLKADKNAAIAFQLANYAILLQQVHTFHETRVVEWDGENARISFKEPFKIPDPRKPEHGRGKWRPFQIAFLLMSLRSTAEGNAPDPLDHSLNTRETVELIWFPTGGGKTEAYLGLTAFALFMRRLTNINDTGTHVIMRYTLRLLTAQQFQRAAGLICAMEYLRHEKEELLGKQEYSIGIWLGGDTTPNSREIARKEFRELQRGDFDAEFHFVLLACPWCRAQIGPYRLEKSEKKGRISRRGRGQKTITGILGLSQRDNTVTLNCSDSACKFYRGLPVYVIDEDIYEKPPSLVIGTVDKFAALAWNPQARSLFGLGSDGSRVNSPPGLIIQDELHLITGPLGSMAGLYETVIDELCTDYRSPDHPVFPKIVTSTATIRRYKEQIRALYNRPDISLFPPAGLEIGDSFFSSYAKTDTGALRRGRQYIGIHATNFGSQLTTQVRVYSSLLQAAQNLKLDKRDPWWTLMIFFNSLRELGGGLTLFQSDIPERIYEICRRLAFPQRRFLNKIRELTGRIASAEIPKALQELEIKASGDEYAVDVCLASNIIEVGIDVDRLSLMCVAGQPKTTSQYIQVTGRVGRRWWERPGLIVTIYSPGKPRDRSHFEKFRSYHERLYAQVEPSSVTPFAAPALRRALHAVMVSYIRQAGGADAAERPTPVPDKLIRHIKDILEKKVKSVDLDERENMLEEFQKRIDEWRVWNPSEWRSSPKAEKPSLLRYTGRYYPDFWKYRSWATPTSMRTVDAEALPEITRLYLEDDLSDIRNR